MLSVCRIKEAEQRKLENDGSGQIYGTMTMWEWICGETRTAAVEIRDVKRRRNQHKHDRDMQKMNTNGGKGHGMMMTGG